MKVEPQATKPDPNIVVLPCAARKPVVGNCVTQALDVSDAPFIPYRVQVSAGLGSEEMALPLSEQIMLDIIAPPIGTCLWWIMSASTSAVLQGGTISERTKNWLRKGFWIVLGISYTLMFGVTAFYHHY